MAQKAAAPRRQRQEEPEKPVNHERYMLTYSDMITLLMTFFVVMYAMSNADKAKYAAVSESLSSAFNIPGAESGGGTGAGGSQVAALKPAGTGLSPKPASKRDPFIQRAHSTLSSDIKSGAVQMNTEARGIVLALSGDVFFAKGSAELEEDAVATLEKVADLIRDLPNQIVVEGHTDSSPVAAADKFGSNLMLSAARAVAVAEALELLSVPKEQLSATGYGDSKPARSNDTPEGRAMNRRVDILIRFDE